MCIEVSNEMQCFVKAHCLGRALFHTSGVDPGEKKFSSLAIRQFGCCALHARWYSMIMLCPPHDILDIHEHSYTAGLDNSSPLIIENWLAYTVEKSMTDSFIIHRWEEHACLFHYTPLRRTWLSVLLYTVEKSMNACFIAQSNDSRSSSSTDEDKGHPTQARTDSTW